MTLLLEMTRSGGREPSDHERLAIGPDGAFSMWRTVAWTRAGAFAGVVDEDVLRSVEKAVAAVPAGETKGEVPRYAATETFRTPDGAHSLGGSSDPPSAWAPLVEVGRRLLNDLTAQPASALQLSVPSSESAVLEVVGMSDLAAAPESLRWRAERLDADGVPLGTWRPDPPHGERDLPTMSGKDLSGHSPGFRMDLEVGHDWDLAPTDIVRVWATIGIGAADDPPDLVRTARLVAVHRAG